MRETTRLVKFADDTDTAAVTRYYPSDAEGWDIRGACSVTIQGYQAGGVTWTIEATNSEMSDGDTIWHDVSKLFVDLNTGVAGTASWVDDASLMIQLSGINAQRLRIKEIKSDATNVVLGWIRFSNAAANPGLATVGASALPAGAATAAKQDTGNGSLASILAKLVAPGTWTPATAAAGADSAVITAAATTARAILAANSHAATTIYLQIFDSASVPADGTAPRIPSIPIAAGQTVLVQLGALACANGLSWAASSTVATKTITALTSVQCSAEIGA